MDKVKSIEQINEIKKLMEGSSKFLSLSGMSGVSAGVVATLSSIFAYLFLYEGYAETFLISFTGEVGMDFRLTLVFVAFLTLIFAIGFGFLFTYKKVQKRNEKLLSREFQKLLFEVSVPLVTAGIILIILFDYRLYGLMAPLTLVFYGLALFTASKYTVKEIRYLALCEVLLGIIALTSIGYGLLFWWIGFGLLHIIYGIFIHLKYDKK